MFRRCPSHEAHLLLGTQKLCRARYARRASCSASCRTALVTPAATARATLGPSCAFTGLVHVVQIGCRYGVPTKAHDRISEIVAQGLTQGFNSKLEQPLTPNRCAHTSNNPNTRLIFITSSPSNRLTHQLSRLARLPVLLLEKYGERTTEFDVVLAFFGSQQIRFEVVIPHIDV